MRAALLFAMAMALAPLPLDAIRSFSCTAGFRWLAITVGTTETVEIRSQPSGVILYPANTDCNLFLSAESSSDRLTVEFSTFMMVAPDTVMLYDGGKVVDGWSNSYGAVSRPFTTTATSSVRVSMQTDGVNRAAGFVANVYVAVSSPAVVASTNATVVPASSAGGAASSFRSVAPPSSSLGAVPISSVGVPSSSVGPAPTSSVGAVPSSSAGPAPSSSVAAVPSSSVGPAPISSSGAAPTPSIRAAPTASVSSQSLSPSPWQPPFAKPSWPSAGATMSTSQPSIFKKAASPNATADPSLGCPNCENGLSTSSLSPQTRNVHSAAGPQSTTNVIGSVSTEIRSAPSISTPSRETGNHLYIKYLPGSHISAFQISIPLMLSYVVGPSRWTDGDFGPMVLGLASILRCNPDRIQNVTFQPASTSQYPSELQLLILSSRDAFDTSALLLGTQLSSQMQNLSNPLRSIEILNLAPEPPVNVTMEEVLLTICSNSTYAIDHCPGSNAELASVGHESIVNSNFVMVAASATVLIALIAIALFIRHRIRRRPFKASGSEAITSPAAINCEDSEPAHPGQIATKHRTNLSFALPKVTQHYQVKRAAYDEMHMTLNATLNADDKQDQNYMKKRNSSFQFAHEDGNISAME